MKIFKTLRLALIVLCAIAASHAAAADEWMSKRIPKADLQSITVQGQEIHLTHKHLPKNYYGRYEQSGGRWGWYFVLRPDGTGETATEVATDASGYEYSYVGAEVTEFRWGIVVEGDRFSRTAHTRAWYGDSREFTAALMVAWSRGEDGEPAYLVRPLHEGVSPDGRRVVVLGQCSKAF